MSPPDLLRTFPRSDNGTVITFPAPRTPGYQERSLDWCHCHEQLEICSLLSVQWQGSVAILLDNSFPRAQQGREGTPESMEIGSAGMALVTTAVCESQLQQLSCLNQGNPGSHTCPSKAPSRKEKETCCTLHSGFSPKFQPNPWNLLSPA